VSQLDRAPGIAVLASELTGLLPAEAERQAAVRLATWPDPEAWTDEEIALDIQYVQGKGGQLVFEDIAP
jgi:hypothetical protein